jgi:hypothetical protein
MLSREEYIGADRSVSFRYYVRAPTYMQRSHDQVRHCERLPHGHTDAVRQRRRSLMRSSRPLSVEC